MSHSRIARDRRAYIRSPLLGGIELLAAEFVHQVCRRHSQDQVVIGIMEAGRIGFSGGGIDTQVQGGDLLFIAPGVVHEAEVCGAWTYRALYLTPEQWERARDMVGAPRATGAAVLRDERLSARVLGVHRRLVSGQQIECDLDDLVRTLVQAIAGHRAPQADVMESEPVRETLTRVRLALDEAGGRRVTLSDMATLAGLSRFHLVRAFTSAFGVSPYAYSLNRRLQAAQRLLAAGEPISMTALEVGFSDQAHLTRHFLHTVGVTPGEYQRAFARPRVRRVARTHEQMWQPQQHSEPWGSGSLISAGEVKAPRKVAASSVV